MAHSPAPRPRRLKAAVPHPRYQKGRGGTTIDSVGMAPAPELAVPWDEPAVAARFRGLADVARVATATSGTDLLRRVSLAAHARAGRRVGLAERL